MHGFISAVLRLWRGGSAPATARQTFGRARSTRRSYEPDLTLLQLEPRRLLNADFSVLADAVQLNLSDALSADTLTVSRVGNDYQFSLNNGENWQGVDDGNVEGNAMSVLSIDATFADSLPSGIQILDDSQMGVVLNAGDFSSLASLSLFDVDSVQSVGQAFQVPQLNIASFTETPFRLSPLNVDGNVSITSASTVEEAGTGGPLRVTGDLSITAGVLPGDFDGDNMISSAELDIVRDNFGDTTGVGDANGDGRTDGIDLALVREGVGRTVDAGNSAIEIGVALDIEVGGATQLASTAGGEIRAGVTGADVDSGRTVDLGILSFQTTGDVSIADDSADGVDLGHRDFDGDGMLDANTADDVTLQSADGVRLVGLLAGDLTVTAGGNILEGAAVTGAPNELVLTGDVTLTASSSGPFAADFNADGAVDTTDFAIWRDNYGAPGGPGDANGDGSVDAIDYALWRESRGAVTATGDIRLGDAFDLSIGGQATLVSTGNGDINLGAGAAVELATVRFDTSGMVAITETSVDGLSLRRNGAQGSRASDASLRTTNGGVTLDSLNVATLTVDSVGDITDNAGSVITVTGLASFTAGGDITLGEDGAANFGSLALEGGVVTVEEASSTNLADVSVAQLTITSTGDVVDNAGALVAVTGPARFVAAGDILLGRLDIGGPITLQTTAGANATLANATAIDLAASSIAGNLTLTTTTGGITDSGVVTVGGMAQFTTLEGGADILFDQLAVTGMIGLTTNESAPDAADADATIVNATAIDLKTTTVEGDLTATATTGDIANPFGAVTVASVANFTASVGDITLMGFVNFGSLSLTGGDVVVSEGSATELLAVDVERLTLNAAGDITDVPGASLIVRDTASFNTSRRADIQLADGLGDLFTVGSLAAFTGGEVVIGAAGDANFGELSLQGGNAIVTEGSTTNLRDVSVSTFTLTSAGDILEAQGPLVSVNVSDDANLTGNDIVLGNFTTPPNISVVNFGRLSLDANDVTIEESSGTALLNVDVASLSITSGGFPGIVDEPGASVIVAGPASFTTFQGQEITLDSLTVAGPITLVTGGNATIVNATAINLGASSIAGNLTATATTGGITDSGAITVAGMAQFTSLGGGDDIVLDQLAVTGPIGLTTTESTIDAGDADATIVNATAIDFKDTFVFGDFTATALTGDILNNNAGQGGIVFATGSANLTASGGGIFLGMPAAAQFGSLSAEGGSLVISEADGMIIDRIVAQSADLSAVVNLEDSDGAVIDVTGAARFHADVGVLLADNAADVLKVGGLATFLVGTPALVLGDITVGDAGTANFGSLSLTGDLVTVQEDSSTTLVEVMANELNLTSAGPIDDSSNLVINGDANFVATGPITLADNAGDILTVGGVASFTAGGNIELGQGGDANFGTLQLDTSGQFDATVREMSSTQLGDVDVRDLTLDSGGSVTDRTGAIIQVAGDATVDSSDAITLADNVTDVLRVGAAARFSAAVNLALGFNPAAAAGQANFGSLLVSAVDATIRESSSTRLDGVTATTLDLESTSSITDVAGAQIVVTDDASFTAGGTGVIALANVASDTISIGGHAQFTASGAISIGPAGMTNFGSLSLAGTMVEVQEDSSTRLVDINAESLDLRSSGSITNGRFSDLDITGDAIFTANGGAIDLGSGGDSRLFVGAVATFTATGDLTLGRFGEATFGSLRIAAADVFVQEDDATLLRGVMGTSLALESGGAVTDAPHTSIVVTGDATFTATDAITLNDTAPDTGTGQPGDVLNVGGKASFSGTTITIGPAGRFVAGQIQFNSPGAVAIQEDDSTEIAMANTASLLDLQSSGAITDAAATTIDVTGDATFTAVTDVTLNDNGDDVLTVGGKASFAATQTMTPTLPDGTISIGGQGDFNARMINFNAPGAVAIQEDSDTEVAMDNTAGALVLESAGEITVSGTITVSGFAKFLSGGAIELAFDIAAAQVGLFAGGAITQTAGAITTPELLVMAGGDVSLASATNDIAHFAADVQEGSIDLFTKNSLTIADLTINGMNVAGVTITDTGAASMHTLRLEAAGGDIDQQLQSVGDARIDVDVQNATFVVADGDSILLDDLAIDANFNYADTNNRFFNDNANALRETDLVFTSAGKVADLTVLDQTAVLLLGVDITGDLSVVAGRSPDAREPYEPLLPPDQPDTGRRAILDAGPVLVDGNVRLHAFGGQAGDLAIQVDSLAALGTNLAGLGNLVITTDVGDARVVNDTAIALRNDLATNVQGTLTLEAQSGDLTDAPAASITVTGDSNFSAIDEILLNDAAGDLLSVGGKASFAATQITVGSDGTFNAGQIQFKSAGAVSIQEDSGTEVAMSNTAESLTIDSAGEITDATGVSITVQDDASLIADGNITLNDQTSDHLEVFGEAAFEVDTTNLTGAISIGPAGTFLAGALNFNAKGAVAIQEDDATEIVKANTANRLTLRSSGVITDGDMTTIAVQLDATFSAGDIPGSTPLDAAGTITLGDHAGDEITVGRLATFRAGGPINLATSNGALLNVGGNATFMVDTANPAGSITVGPAGMFFAGSISFIAKGDVSIQEDDATQIVGKNSAGTLLVDSEENIEAEGSTVVGGAATFLANTGISISRDTTSTLQVGGKASFEVDPTNPAGAISVGFDDALGAGGRFFAGTLNFNAQGAVAIQENSGDPGDAFTRLAMDNTAGTLILESDGSIVDEQHTSIVVTGAATLQAAGTITLGDTGEDAANSLPGDVLDVGALAEFIAGGDIAIGPAGDANFGQLSLIDLKTSANPAVTPTITATVYEDSATDLVEVAVGTLTLRSQGEITDDTDAELQIADVATFDTGSNARDVVLGDDGAALRLGTKLDASGEQTQAGIIRFFGDAAIAGDTDRQVAANVSLQVVNDFLIGDTRVAGTYFATARTLAGSPAAATASIDQAGTLDASDADTTAVFVADRLGLAAANGSIFMATADVNRFAAEARGASDITSRDPRAVDAAERIATLIDQLASERITAADEAARSDGEFNLAPTEFTNSTDAQTGQDLATLSSLAVDNQFGVVMLSHAGDLEIGHVGDRTGNLSSPGPAGAALGVRSTSGHVYLETEAIASADAAEPGNLTFTAGANENGDAIADKQAVRITGDHVFTAVAAGDLVIDTAAETDLVAEGALGNGRGVVTDVSIYVSYDDRDGFDGFTTNIPAGSVLKEGVLLQVTPPSTELGAPTTRLVGEGNLSSVDGTPIPNTQSLDLEFGRARETNLIVYILWADRDLPTDSSQVTRVESPTTAIYTDASTDATVPFLHEFASVFLNIQNRTRDYGAQPILVTPLDLPTDIAVLNDPRINLYSEQGAQNLNRSVTPSDAPTPSRIDNFVLATSQTITVTEDNFVPPEAPPLFVPPPPIFPPEPVNTPFLQTTFEAQRRVATRERIEISYGPVDEAEFGDAVAKDKEIPIIEELKVDWEKGPDNYVAQIKQEILADPNRPAGRYVIKAKSPDQDNPIEEVFVKPSTVEDPYEGAGVFDNAIRRTDAIVDKGPAKQRSADNPAWTAAWVDWATRRQTLNGDASDLPTPEDPRTDQGEAVGPSATLQDVGGQQPLTLIDGGRASSARHTSVGALMVGGVLLMRQTKQQEASVKTSSRGLRSFRRRPR